MKILICALVSVLSSQLVFGQGAFERRTMFIQPGIGYGLVGTAGDVLVPPISLCVEYGSSREWSFGGYLGYAASKERLFSLSNEDYGFKYSYLILGGRGSFHFDSGNEMLDTYAGVMLGYNVVSVSTFGDSEFSQESAAASALLYGFHLGARYMLSPSLGVFGEAGYGIGYLTVGITIKPSTRTQPSEKQWEQPVGDMEWEEESENEEKYFEAQVIKSKKHYLLIDLGESDGLSAGMKLELHSLLEDSALGENYGTAEVIEVRPQRAIIKAKASVAQRVADGDRLAVKIM